MTLNPTKSIWMNGEFVPWRDAKVHVLTHTLHYGLGVFEGIRCYETSKGPAVFRLREHMKRLENSAKLMKIQMPFSVQDLIKAVKETIKENDLTECYIRPIVFYGYGVMGLNPKEAEVNVSISVWPWGTYLGEEGLEKGIKATISKWKRIHPKILPPQSKTVANYANSILAKLDALERGYEEAILLNMDNHVAEGPGENLFIIENDEIITPPLSSGALKGITRESIISIAKDESIRVIEESINLERLQNADEAFFTGTAAEVTPIREIDDKIIGSGKRGEITEKIQEIFFDTVRGKITKYEDWLEYVR